MDIANSRFLRQCLKISELQSVSRAAEALNVAQPWLSSRLRDYERELGFDIFDRSRRKISLTAEGAEFMEAAKAFLSATDRLSASVGTIRAKAARATLQIGCLPTAAGVAERDRLIEAFERKFPDVEVRIQLLTAPEILDQLAAGGLDLAFMHRPFPSQMRATEWVTLATQYAALFMPKDWGFAEGSPVSLPELKGRTFAVVPAALHPELCTPVYDAMRRFGIELHEMPDGGPLAQQNYAVGHGIGVVIVDSFSDYLGRIAGYGVWRIENDPFRSDLCLIAPLPASAPAANAFWRFAQERFGIAAPSVPG